MSADNTELIRQWLDAWSRADLDEFMSFYDSDAIFITDPSWPESGPFRGRRAIIGFCERFRDAWTGNEAAIVDLRAAGEIVVARAELQGRGLASGIDSELSISCVSKFEGGKIARQQYYLDHAKALEAAGLSE
jgi:ketosteroid isomerase-like protein